MGTRELGLVLAQQLLGVEELHYGLWEKDLPLSLANVPAAQERYDRLLLSVLPSPGKGGPRILEVGCGTGHFLTRLLDLGYQADAVNPSAGLNRLVRSRLERFPRHAVRLFECGFEEFPAEENREAYDVVLFAESFQYVPLDASLPLAERILKPGGLLVICDFFKTDAHGDGLAGDRSMGGGHEISRFIEAMVRAPFIPETERDLTRLVSPNLELLNRILLDRVKPALGTLGEYARSRHPFWAGLLGRIFRKKLEKLDYKYFSGHRSREMFEKYKTYRLLVYRRTG